MHSRGFIEVVVLVTVFIIVAIFLITSSYLKRNPHQVSNPLVQIISSTPTTFSTPTPNPLVSTKPSTEVYGLEPPTLPPNLTWSLVSTEKQELSKPTLRWSMINPRFAKEGVIVLSGKEWIAEELIKSKDQQESIWKFRQDLLDQGWDAGSEVLVLGNYSIRVVGGGGEPPADLLFMGFFKRADEKYRVVNFSVDEPDVPEEGFSKRGYPYDVKYHVFISDVFAKETLLQQIDIDIQ